MTETAAPHPTRDCQPCTACCDGWGRMVIDGVEVYPGHPCPHSTGSGCRIYANRPVDPCRNFECAWHRPGSHLPEWFRPDRARVMVLAAVRSWRGRPVDVAVPVGRRIPPRALNWLKQYAGEHARPLIYLEQDSKDLTREQRTVAYGPPEFQQEVGRLLEAGEKLW